jgi:hypothetical protein
MKEHIGLIAIILAVLLATPACQSDGRLKSGEENDARTYYESLNLETSEDAVQTFAKAFQREDFMTVYLALDAEAQKLLQMENSRTFSWRHLIGENANEGLMDDVGFGELFNTQMDRWYIFTRLCFTRPGKMIC